MNTKPQDSKKKMVRVVEEEPHLEDSVNFLQPAKLYESDYSSGEEDNTVAMIETAVEKVEPLNMPLKIGNINTTLLVDSGSACSITQPLTRVAGGTKQPSFILDRLYGASTTANFFKRTHTS